LCNEGEIKKLKPQVRGKRKKAYINKDEADRLKAAENFSNSLKNSIYNVKNSINQ
jgi:hypothetical protein